jgi:hypothetical protein
MSFSRRAHPIDEIPDRQIRNVVIEPVRGEVAPPDVLFYGAVDVVAKNASGGIERAMLRIGGLHELDVRVHPFGIG